ncbi:CvpA family protein [Latilactobacillus graminis]|uniref:Colicin V production family protein n=2 Tax=Latilactobacillus graminis TaxID=60519 RepID=A0AA89I2P1_9LACO|nr:CvpA family protein [Latilactobacillus graminis]KRM24405.1 colicin V production family protein [Latilactobacillus graminis DSM 20719]QFP80045.1 CvpA family protein [Latilactobacillus graminis]
MLSLIIILILLYAIYIGTRRGFIMQAVYTIGYFIVFWIAQAMSHSLGPKLSLIVPYPSAIEDSYFAFFQKSIGLSLDDAFYIGVAFVLVMFIGSLLVRFSGLLLNSLTYMPGLKRFNKTIGGFLNFLVVYIGIFLLLYVMALVPLDGLQKTLRDSTVARVIVLHTPVLTSQVTSWWIAG